MSVDKKSDFQGRHEDDWSFGSEGVSRGRKLTVTHAGTLQRPTIEVTGKSHGGRVRVEQNGEIVQSFNLPAGRKATLRFEDKYGNHETVTIEGLNHQREVHSNRFFRKMSKKSGQ